MKKTIFVIFVLSAIICAKEFPNKISEIMNASNFYYDEILTFGNEKLVAKIKGEYTNAIFENKNLQIDKNETYKKKLAQLKDKNGDFCGDFFENLQKQIDIKSVEPLNKNILYSDDDFKKNMGMCYFIGMDWYIPNVTRFDGTIFDEDIRFMFKPISYSLYKIDDKDNLLLIQRVNNLDYSPHKSHSNEIYSMLYVVNKNLCDEVLLDKGNDFRLLKDRKILSKTLYEYDIDNFANSENFFDIIEYKGKKYIFETQNSIQHGTKSYFFYDNQLNVVLKEIDFSNLTNIEKIKCKRRFFYTKNI